MEAGSAATAMRRRKQAQRLIEECRELPIEPGGERRIGRVPLGLLQVVDEGPRFPSAPAIRASEAQSFTYSNDQRDADSVGDGGDVGIQRSGQGRRDGRRRNRKTVFPARRDNVGGSHLEVDLLSGQR